MTSIVWDFDGAIANSYPGMVIAVQQSLKENFQLEFSKDTIYHDIKKTSIRNYVTELFRDKVHSEDELKKNVDIFYHDYKFLEKNNQDKINLLPHAKSTFAELKQAGFQQFLVTHRDESIYQLAKTLEIEDYFTEIVSVEKDFRRKPDSHMLDYLIEKYHLDKSNLWVIGDRQIDIDFGRSVSAKTILLTDQNVDLGQDKTITDLNQVLSVIK